MKVIGLKENLLKGISVASRSIGKDANLPVLANILLEAKNGRIKFSATNLEIGTTCWVRGKIESEGAITVPAGLLLNYVSNLPNSNIEFFLNGDVLKIKCAEFSGDVKGIKAAEFPLIPKIDNQPFCKVRADILKQALEKIIFAAAKDEMRPEISGILLKTALNKIKLAATDSYRLGEVVFTPSFDIKQEIQLIMPVATVQELIRIIDNEQAELSLFMMENQIKFAMADWEIVSRLVEGSYPDYEKIIPKSFKTELLVAKDNFLKAIKTTSLFAKKETNEIIIKALAKNKQIELRAESGQSGSSVTKMVCGYNGEDVEAVFNFKYLVEGLNSLSADVVNLRFLGSMGPCMMTNRDEKNHFYIVMPIKR